MDLRTPTGPALGRPAPAYLHFSISIVGSVSGVECGCGVWLWSVEDRRGMLDRQDHVT